MPSIDLVIKLIGTQDVRKWDNPTLLLWAIEMAKLIEANERDSKIEPTLRFSSGAADSIIIDGKVVE